MKSFIFASIMKTGTKFFRGVFMDQGYIWKKAHILRADAIIPEGVVYWMHSTDDFNDLFIKSNGATFPLVGTARSEVELDKSWENLHTHVRGGNTLANQKKNMLSINKRADVIISIDANNRNKRLNDLGDLVGATFVTDWAPVNAR